jgi:hypothetical protein
LPDRSAVALRRAFSATVVVAGLFAFADEVVGNVQMATFATFGAIATLVLTSFRGTRREKLVAHLALAVAGSALVTVGTAASSPVALAALATVPVTFLILFAGISGPNAAAGATGAILAFVLPVASAGALAELPSRLAGWWLASVAGTAAVLAFAPRAESQAVRRAISRLASALAEEIKCALEGAGGGVALARALEIKRELIASSHESADSRLGLGVRDRALANVIDLLEGCTSALADAARDQMDLQGVAAPYRDVLETSMSTLRAIASVIEGDEVPIDGGRLESARARAASHLLGAHGDGLATDAEARVAFHIQTIAVAVLAASADTRFAARTAAARAVASHPGGEMGPLPTTVNRTRIARTVRHAVRNSSLRSVWLLNSVRGSVALALAVAVADLSDVQHGFWVVLGTLSVLRTNASATGATAVRALTGTLLGICVGGALLLAVGGETDVLWAVLPVAVFLAAYTPGTTPLAIGQASFTVLVAIVFNLIVPVGWKVGLVRIEDVAIGCSVSLVAGILLWPRGVVTVVAGDLADAYSSASALLLEAIAWCTGEDQQHPRGGAASISAALRLDDALRAFASESRARKLTAAELQRLSGGALRLRLTALALAGLPTERLAAAEQRTLRRRAEKVKAWYDEFASLLRGAGQVPGSLLTPTFGPGETLNPGSASPYAVWLGEHLDHLAARFDELPGPARHLAETARTPWWR